jgi:hypothetical protein
MARAKTGNRTQDLRITSALLYQLSYLGVSVKHNESGVQWQRGAANLPAAFFIKDGARVPDNV